MRGFDYISQTEFDRPAVELRQLANALVDAGGFRRVENNETFIHAAHGAIALEIYDNLSLSKGRQQ